MKQAFGDAWYFIALLNPRDAAHKRAKSFARSWRGQMVTTRWILAEVADGLASDPHLHALAADFLTHCDTHPSLRVTPVSEDQFAQGLDLYRQRRDKAWSLTDCISFAVMRQEGLREALTGDHHFAQAGFEAVFAG